MAFNCFAWGVRGLGGLIFPEISLVPSCQKWTSLNSLPGWPEGWSESWESTAGMLLAHSAQRKWNGTEEERGRWLEIRFVNQMFRPPHTRHRIPTIWRCESLVIASCSRPNGSQAFPISMALTSSFGRVCLLCWGTTCQCFSTAETNKNSWRRKPRPIMCLRPVPPCGYPFELCYRHSYCM